MESTQVHHHDAWNKSKLVGQKAPFKLKEIWSIRVRLEMQGRLRELPLFDLAVDSKLRACDLLSLRVRDVCHGDRVAGRAIVLQQKTQRPVQVEITPPTREVVTAWIKQAGLKSDSYLFPGRVHESPHLGTRQYARIVDGWVEEIGRGQEHFPPFHAFRSWCPLPYQIFRACADAPEALYTIYTPPRTDSTPPMQGRRYLACIGHSVPLPFGEHGWTSYSLAH